MWVTQTKKRYVKVNNNYIKDQYNLDETSTYLQYLGKKNLYGWAVIQKLPIHEFAWQKVDDFTTEKIDKLLKKVRQGYILEVNVQYPKELHKKHNELLFLAERMKMEKVEKLAQILKDKITYVVHFKNLGQALTHGLKLKKMHRVIELIIEIYQIHTKSIFLVIFCLS